MNTNHSDDSKVKEQSDLSSVKEDQETSAADRTTKDNEEISQDQTTEETEEPTPVDNDKATKTDNEQNVEGAGKDSTQADQADVANAWVAEWDANSQAYYWWNTITYETTWDNPTKDGNAPTQTYDYSSYYYGYRQPEQAAGSTPSNQIDSLLDKIDTQVRPTLDGATSGGHEQVPYEAYFAQQSQADPYKFQAYFNTKTGKFQTSSEVDRLNPERMSIENRAKRQMQYYFDVDGYMEQRNREKALGIGQKRPQLTKKDIERFKKQKHEKKMRRAREWLCD
ncbi:hypothetical protein EC973_004394 [Apophysomyces ossiformis]|uniref:WW domain-containing protein n=1 Tax=Apophysomyces ossiformis TaxID=679940 RepID=A0A8H7ET80_9FUNG|nr:hypothetical protein EC973_004394 [Apophysomyces ossiformis]